MGDKKKKGLAPVSHLKASLALLLAGWLCLMLWSQLTVGSIVEETGCSFTLVPHQRGAPERGAALPQPYDSLPSPLMAVTLTVH